MTHRSWMCQMRQEMNGAASTRPDMIFTTCAGGPPGSCNRLAAAQVFLIIEAIRLAALIPVSP